MSTLLERSFALAAVAVVIGSLGLVAVAPADGATERPKPVGDTVPDEYTFEAADAPGRATLGGQAYESVQAAVDAAEPGDTVELSGTFEEHVVVRTPNLTIQGRAGGLAAIDGGGTGDVLTVESDGVTIRRVWVRGSGFSASGNDAGIWINGTDVTVVDSRLSEVTFGIWVDGVAGVRLVNNTIVGRESVHPLSYRGNGIQLWKAERGFVARNRITDVRDGIYYSWASEVLATENTMWDLRYGVHYMYSDDCQLVGNLAFDSDAGYALMVSKRLTLRENVAVNNTGTSGHGILLKSVDETRIVDNEVVGNTRGLYVFNSLDNRIEGNLVLGNDIGVYLAAGSVREQVTNNSFIRNGQPVLAVIGEQVNWNGSTRGNYWSGARDGDIDHDGVSEIRYRPAGLVEHLVYEHPEAAVFAGSPAFDAIRLAQSTVPIIESPGVIDHHPLARPNHHHWRRYYGRD